MLKLVSRPKRNSNCNKCNKANQGPVSPSPPAPTPLVTQSLTTHQQSAVHQSPQNSSNLIEKLTTDRIGISEASNPQQAQFTLKDSPWSPLRRWKSETAQDQPWHNLADVSALKVKETDDDNPVGERRGDEAESLGYLDPRGNELSVGDGENDDEG